MPQKPVVQGPAQSPVVVPMVLADMAFKFETRPLRHVGASRILIVAFQPDPVSAEVLEADLQTHTDGLGDVAVPARATSPKYPRAYSGTLGLTRPIYNCATNALDGLRNAPRKYALPSCQAATQPEECPGPSLPIRVCGWGCRFRTAPDAPGFAGRRSGTRHSPPPGTVARQAEGFRTKAGGLPSGFPSLGPAGTRGRAQPVGTAACRLLDGAMHVPILGFHVLVRLLHDLLEDGQLDVAEPLDVDADPAGGVFAQASQEFGVARGAVHQVNRDLAFGQQPIA